MNKTENLLRHLIALPSVNPAFLPARDPKAGEKRVADFVAATAARAGMDIEMQSVLPDRSNVLCRLSPRGKARKRILLAPHLDTVNGSDGQFSPVSRNGRVFGRGASDTKGSVAAMLDALCDVARGGKRPADTEIIFAGLIDEENGQAGSRFLSKSGMKADLAIVGEPTRLQVVTAHKGILWLELETRGKAAHGARPELGRNAVHAMARVVDLLETEYASNLRRKRHPLLGTATVNVGTVSGGTQANIVPDRCTISIDRRTLPGETEASVRREIAALLRRHGLRASFLSTRMPPCFPLETGPSLPQVQNFIQVIGQAKPAGVHYFCDAAVLARGGIPSVVFGPGDIAQGHTADEWIAINSLERGKRMLEAFLRSLP